MARNQAEDNPFSSPNDDATAEEFVVPLDQAAVLQRTVFLARLMLGIAVLFLLGACAAVYFGWRFLSENAGYGTGLLRPVIPLTWYLYYLGPPIVYGLCYFGLIFGIARFASAARRLLYDPEADPTAAFSALNHCLVLVAVILCVLVLTKVLVAMYGFGVFD